jgi:sigma-E factor negative regulatory protein RseA
MNASLGQMSGMPGTSTGADADSLCEQLSALADGQGPATPEDWSRLTQAYGESDRLRHAWHDYHWLGDALRAGDHAPAPADSVFVAGVMARLQSEQALPLGSVAPRTSPREAANDAVFRWKMVAGVASLAAVVAVAWQVVAGPSPVSGPQLARATAVPQVVRVAEGDVPSQAEAVLTPQGVMIRDPQLEALLAAHRQYGGVSALQTPAGFLRNATYETPQR